MRNRRWSTITALVAAGLCICWGATAFANPGDPAADKAPTATSPPVAEPTVESVVPFVVEQTFGELDPPEPGGPRDGGPRSSCSGDITLGSGTSTTANYPLSGITNPCYARSMSLIRRSEMSCTPWKITQLAIYISTAKTMNFYEVEIRMMNVTTTAFPSGTVPWDGTGTLVYGPTTVQMTPTGWMVFNITDFIWDADYNLQITWQGRGVGGGGTNYPYYYQTADLGWRCEAMSNSTTAYNNNMTPFQTRPQYKLTFEPTLTGACCNGMDCTFVATEADCVNLGGTFMGTGSDCSPNPCRGACCYNYPNVQCINTPDAATCTTSYSGTWYANTDCATFYCPPWNDLCTAVTPVTLVPGVPATFTGDTRGSTDNCSVFAGNESWLAYTLTAAYTYWDVVLDYCTTSPAFGTCWLNRTTSCPCGTITAAAIPDYWPTCGDGNRTIRWSGSGPGTNWYPILMDPNLAFGPYTIHILARPGYCSAVPSSNTQETIKNVTLVGNTPPGINNTTTDCDTYNNFRDLPAADLTTGMTYGVSLTIGDCEGTGCQTKRAVIYIDWNQDYDFADAGEQAWYSGTTAIPATPCPDITVYPSITVPVNATLGTTRMRVIVAEASAVPPACGAYVYGATEDYTINVLAPVGACCSPDGSCAVTTEAQCVAPGIWHADWPTCNPNPCPQPATGACCFGAVCQIRTEAQCLAEGGVYQGDDTDCFPNPCVPLPDYWLRVVGGIAVEQGGNGYDHEWYLYPNNWWNQWWYNEFALDREKEVTITFDIQFLGVPPVVAFNFSAPDWPDEQNPPLPADEAFVVRLPVDPPITAAGTYTFTTRLPFCPRWVSMDVQGLMDFAIQGTIQHVCLPAVYGACCFADGHCEDLTQYACTQADGTQWMQGIPCLPANPCPQPCSLMGDLNDDTYVNGLDIQGFVDCLLGSSTDCRCGDFNGNDVVDMGDMSGFIAVLLSP
jgi:hypothetical protein